MRRALGFFAFVGIGNLAVCQSLHYSSTFAGSPAGSITYSRGSDGTVKASSILQVGTTALTEDLIAKFAGGKLISSECDAGSPAGKSKVIYADGKLTFRTSKGEKSIPYTPKQNFYGGNLIAPLWETSVARALILLDRQPQANSVTVPTFLIDVGGELPIIYRRMPARKATVAGKTVVAQAFQINLANVQAEIDRNSDGTIVAFDVPAQKLRFVLDGWAGLYDDPFAKYPELSQPVFKTKTESAVSMKTRDGVELVATIIRPNAPGKFPTILERTPYERASGLIDGPFYASRGYVFISQDVRGRGSSGGEWDPFVHEGEDGFDTIQWITEQPWSDGKVGMIGGSYGGYVQWAAAVLRPNGLKCIVPQVSPPDAMHNLPYDFGVPFLYADLWWAKIVAGKSMDLSSFQGPLPHLEKMATLPLADIDQAVLGQKVPFLQKWLNRPTIDDWKGFDFYQHLSQADVPALQISGWFDGDGIGTKLIWAEERRLGRKDQWLIEGPWTHAFNTTSSIGQIDYGPDAIIDLDSLYLRWFDTWLKGKSVNLSSVPKVRVFVTGANKWQNLSDWPAPEERSETLYLSGKGTPQSRVLTSMIPTNGSETYSYDPAKDTDTPSLTKVGSGAESYNGIANLPKSPNGGFFVYETAPLKQDTAIAGPAAINLNFQTDARDTDFFASIVDVDEKGAMHVFGQSGKIRGSYLNGVKRRIPLIPGKIYMAAIQPWEFAHQIKAGHKIGVLITSTMFPLYARNLGTGESVATGSKIVVQHNRILFGKSHPSSVTFQVMELK